MPVAHSAVLWRWRYVLIVLAFAFLFTFTWEIGFDVSLGINFKAVKQKTPPSAKLHFWRFIGVSSDVTKDRAEMVATTWGSRANITWFVDELDGPMPPHVHPIVRVTDGTYLSEKAAGNGYKFMAFKLQWVWDYVNRHLDDAEWFIRHFDDAYIFLQSLRAELKVLNSSLPIVLGHRHYSKGNFEFPDGGMPWCMSRAALKLWQAKTGISQCIRGILSDKKAREIFGPETHEWANCKDPKNPGLWCAEDIFLWYCLQQSGVQFVKYLGRVWPPEDLGQPSFDWLARRSMRGIVSGGQYHPALHPVPVDVMKKFWAEEKTIAP